MGPKFGKPRVIIEDSPRAGKAPRPPKTQSPIRPIAPKGANELLYYGFHAVRALFKARRDEIIRAYCVEERLGDMGDLLKWCSKNKKAYHVVTKEDLEKITGSVHHEGVALLAQRRATLNEKDLYERLKTKKQPLIVLDEVLNPHNIGSIMRIMAHFGWSYLVCDEKHAVPLSASTARMSEGGSEYVDLCYYKNTPDFLRNLKSLGYELIGTSTHGRKSLYALDLKSKAQAFFLGNEVRGLNKDLMKALDTTVAIPSIGEVQSLNVATACALMIGECVRQQGVKS